MTTVYICERRKFATLDAARAYAQKWYERYRIIVAITERQTRTGSR